MPTLQVKPTSSDLLQHVADSLGKARKVVIITGAGISTNSGIPDFRSENGLYSLIQAQFERAEASRPGDVDGQAADYAISARPAKRRRISRTVDDPTPTRTAETVDDYKKRDEPLNRSLTDPGNSMLVASDDLLIKPKATTPSELLPQRLTRSQSALRPTLPRHVTQSSIQSSASQESLFSSSQPSRASSRTNYSATYIISECAREVRTRDTAPKALPGESFSSSPLSSPPPVLFDPYVNGNSLSTDGSSRGAAESPDTSDSEETQNSLDLLSSQSSNPSLRNMKGRDLFDCNIWADPLKTSVFYRFATTLRQKVKEVEPTATHRFIAQLRDVGKLARVYTQNIDEIEKKIGLSTDLKSGAGNKRRKSAKQQVVDFEKDSKGNLRLAKEGEETNGTDTGQASSQGSDNSGPINSRPVFAQDKGVECVFLHGSLHALRCFVCGKLCDWDEDGRESCTLLGEQPECPHCAGATAARQERGKRALGVGKLRPDIVLYGEEHPQSDLISPIVQHDLSAGPDLLLILGTSLRVHGLKVMVKEFAKAVHNKGGKVVFINLTKPSESAWGDILDYWIEWDCDAWVDDLKGRKPHLWLSPDEILEYERRRREALAEKKKESVSKKRLSLGDRRRHTIELGRPRPPPKNPSSMRNDYQCGAHVVWEIFQALAKIGNRPFDNLGYSPPRPPLPPAPDPPPSGPPALATRSRPAAKARKTRKSAPAAFVDTANTEPKSRPAAKAKSLARCNNSRGQYEKAAQELVHTGRSPATARLADPNRAPPPHGKSATPPHMPPGSIAGVVTKTLPLQRRRKVIDSLPVAGTASEPAFPAPAHPNGAGPESISLPDGSTASTTRDTLSSNGPILPPIHPGWERSPPAKIKPLEPSLNVSPRSPLADIQVFAIRQTTHPMFFSDPLAKLRYGTTNYKSPPKEDNSVLHEKTPSPSDQLRWELAQREAFEGARVLEGLRYSR
ncbi:DHS-like NAD/FAD-binding domain-containing protein [Hypoxylon sp. NC1633]|nr:DHS-like NAD/FAD-binding domain-containing protein [Hypoxylon sp. NC1633]